MSKNSPTVNSIQIYTTKKQTQLRKRSGSQSSMNQISSTSRITVQSPNYSKALPSLPYSESNQPFSLKQNFKSLIDSISDFLSSTNSNFSYYDSLSSKIPEVDIFFSNFITLLQKQNTSLIQNRIVVSQFSGNSLFGNSVTELVACLRSLMGLLNEISENRNGDDIRQSISQQFDIISENLSIIFNSNINSSKSIITKPKPSSISKLNSSNGIPYAQAGGNYSNQNTTLSSIHNPLIKRLKLMEKQANSIRNLILDQKNALNHHEILNDLRLFSRDMNTSFSNEFSNSSLSLSNKEKIRFSTITACNDIIQGVKNLILRDTKLSQIFNKYEIFQKNFNLVLDQFGIQPLIIERKFFSDQSNLHKSASLTDFFCSPRISPSMTLKNIIEASKPYITNNVNNLIQGNKNNDKDKPQHNDELIQFIDTFFSVISIKAEDLLQNDFNLSSQIGDFQLKNAQMASKSRQMEATISELQEKLALQSPTPIDDEGITSDEYMKCLRHVAKRIRAYLDDKTTDFLSYNMPQMMNFVEKLSEELSSRTCPRCLEHENSELKVKEILRPILNSISLSDIYEIKSTEMSISNSDLLPMAIRAQACFDQLQNENKNHQENLENLTNELILLKSSVRKIAKEFDDINVTSASVLALSPETKPSSKAQKNTQNVKIKTNNNNIDNCEDDSESKSEEEETVVDSIIKHIKKLKNQVIGNQSKNSPNEISREEIEKDISLRFSRLFQLDSKKKLNQQFEIVKKNLDTQKKLYNDAQQTLREVEIALKKKMNEEGKQQEHGTTVCESVRNLLKKFDTFESPFQILAKSLEKHEQILLSNLLAVESTLSGVLKRDPPENLDETKIDQIMSSVIQLSDDVADWSEKILRDERKKKPDSIKARAMIEILYAKLRKFLNLESENGQTDDMSTNLETSVLVSSISEYVDNLINMCSNEEESFSKNFKKFDRPNMNLNFNISSNDKEPMMIRADAINNIFSSILIYISESARKDPLKLMPEIAFKFAILQESIDSLNPFADVLNEIFKSFDCKLKSFTPGSESFAFIRQQVFQLHNLLNAVGPSRIHSLVFLVLSKFVSLMSSFLSAISSMSYEEEEIIKKKINDNKLNNDNDSSSSRYDDINNANNNIEIQNDQT